MDTFENNISMVGAAEKAALIPAEWIFREYRHQIKADSGFDPFEPPEKIKADNDSFRGTIERYRHMMLPEMQRAVWLEYQRSIGILSPDEQQARDEINLQKARTAKDELRLSGVSDVARFGYCKRRGCINGKNRERLLIRGFCPLCRGVAVKQIDTSAIPEQTEWNEWFKNPSAFDATHSGDIQISVVKSKTHPATLKLTSEERHALVLAEKQKNPSATEREIAELTSVPRSTVGRILRTQSVKAQHENSDEVKLFLEDRARKTNPELAEQPSIYQTTTKSENPWY